MRDNEKAIVMAYTGICMLAGDKLQIFYRYVESLMGRPIMTHEIELLSDEIKEKSKADFIALCADESDSGRGEFPIVDKHIQKQVNNVLDKIGVEIRGLQTYKMFEGDNTLYVEGDDVLAIINKYKIKSEN